MKYQNGKKSCFFDLDGTLVTRHLWLGLFKHHLKTRENLFWSFWYLVSHMALMPLWKIHLIHQERFYRSWGEDLAIMVKGMKQDRTKEIFNWIADEYLLPSLKRDIFEKLKKHQKENFLTILTSGSFQDLVEIIAGRIGIDFAVGTKLEIFGDKFSGKIIPPFCFKEGKVERVKNLIKEKNLSINFKESFAYSDSAFDLPILKLVGNPVAVDPDNKLLRIAQNKSWTILKT